MVDPKYTQSSESFPGDFEKAIDWWDARTKTGELVRKSNLKDKLIANFDKDVDYKIDNGLNLLEGFAEISAKPYGGRPREVISLTVECFKMMGIMIAGERGNQIRRYFIRCEVELKRRIAQEQEARKGRVLNVLVSQDHHAWAKRYEDEFFEEAYRDPNNNKRPPCVGTWTNNVVFMHKNNPRSNFDRGLFAELSTVLVALSFPLALVGLLTQV